MNPGAGFPGGHCYAAEPNDGQGWPSHLGEKLSGRGFGGILVGGRKLTLSQRSEFTVLCLACYFKGGAFLEEAKRQGCRVIFVTARRLAEEPWPYDSIDQTVYMDEADEQWDMPNLVRAVAAIMAEQRIDRIVPLDDFDLEKAAHLREHFRIPGLGETRTRYFRDKLAMREQAREKGILVPDFVHAANNQQIDHYLRTVPGPWLCKPRSQASAIGIKKSRSPEELWEAVNQLGDERSRFVIERFVPGEIFHVDSIVYGEQVAFARVHKYAAPPMQTAHEGGVFCTAAVEYGSDDERALQDSNRRLIQALGLRRGVTHTEFIKAHEDGRFYFLETAARVGGAHIAEMLEASSGLNLWTEWARLETLRPGEEYQLPPPRTDYSGIVISLARQEQPDTSSYNDPEIAWRLQKRHHVGLVVTSSSLARVQELLAGYTQRFYDDFFATAPPREKPSA